MEIQNLGWNALTISAIGTLILTLLRTWSYWKQARTIWRQRSGKSVPVTLYGFQLSSFLVMTWYGVNIDSYAVIISGILLALANLPVLVMLAIFKGLTLREIVLNALFLLGVSLMSVPGMSGILFIVYICAAVFLVGLQPYDIWRNRDAGAVDPRVLIVSLVNSACWLLYAIYLGDLLLILANVGFGTVWLLATVLWFRFRTATKATAPAEGQQAESYASGPLGALEDKIGLKRFRLKKPDHPWLMLVAFIITLILFFISHNQ